MASAGPGSGEQGGMDADAGAAGAAGAAGEVVEFQAAEEEARAVEDTQLEQAVMEHAIVEDDVYERVILNTPDILRDVVKGALVQKYIEELNADNEESAAGGPGTGAGGTTIGGTGAFSPYTPSDAGRQRLVHAVGTHGGADDDDDDDGAFRERSFSEPVLVESEYPDVAGAADFNVPGGFRRQFVTARNVSIGKGGGGAALSQSGGTAQQAAAAASVRPSSPGRWSSVQHRSLGGGSPQDAAAPYRATSFLDALLDQFSPAVYSMIERQIKDDSEEASDDGSDSDSDFDVRSQFIIDFGHDGGGTPALGRRALGEVQKTGRSKTMLTLFKCFVATGVMFLPSGFRDAGLVAGAFTVSLVAVLSLYGMSILLRTKEFLQTGGGVGAGAGAGAGTGAAAAAAAAARRSRMLEDTSTTPLLPPISETHQVDRSGSVDAALGSLRRAAGLSEPGDGPPAAPPVKKVNVSSYSMVALHSVGPGGKWVVQTSILFSQIGFCCVYVSFIGNSLFGVVGGWPLWAWIMLVVPFVTPLTFIRHLKYFAIPNLVANIFVIFCVLYLIIVACVSLATGEGAADAEEDGPNNWDCDLGDRQGTACFWLATSTYPMFFGSAVYVFEGITMVIPVQNSMRQPEQLPGMLNLVVGGVALLFVVFAGVNFYAYAQHTQPIVINNLGPQGQVAVTAMFVPVALFMFPLMVFPAARIIEQRLFKKLSRSGFKWQKNFVRTCIVLLCVLVSIAAGEKVDKLVAIIGGLFCVPIAMVYPPLFFLKSGCAKDFWTEVLPASALFLFGCSAATISTCTAVLHFSD